MKPTVSLIIPCRNEYNYIETVIDNLIGQDYPSDKIEIIIAEGRSDDGTVERIKAKAAIYPNILIIDNEEKVVPYGLNKAIQAAKGEYIVRIDAHCEYPSNYVSRLIEVHQELNAENTGGVWITRPGSNSEVGKTIALATSHAFGIGNSYYRLGTEGITEVDTVPYGCFKKDLFDRIGYFDTDLTRNQDDEFNARIIKNGGKIYLIPDLEIIYFARPTWQKMSKMFYQYGLFKPLANKKVGHISTVRQLVPFAFVLYVLFGLSIAFIGPLFCWLYLSGLGFYFLVNLFISTSIALKHKKGVLLMLLPITFVTIHFSYGWGYLRGIIKYLILNKQTKKQLDTSR